MNLALPLGIDNFEKVREDGYYYVDKTEFIRKLIETRFEANLITRPRRFGKSLAMSMLEDFFDISRDSRAHFEGLSIANDEQLCDKWMNKWPVVALTLKDVDGIDFDRAYEVLKVLISDLCLKYDYLAKSTVVSDADKKVFRRLIFQNASMEDLTSSLFTLCRMMNAHYGKPVILIIDEYDVPLDKASEHGYYSEMMSVIRILLGRALKTNPFLKFAVVTGCLRISKESIFTGINNLVTDSITGDRFKEYIGFTPGEVDRILQDAGLSDHAGDVKRWYDGYRFGDVDVYCPWSVLNYINDLQRDRSAEPKDYWVNTSSNGVIYRFISRDDLHVNDKFETLMDGGSIITPVEENLTYDMIDSSEENLWSLMYLTGYLTIAKTEDMTVRLSRGEMALRIPNEEVKSVFAKTIKRWFDDSMRTEDRHELFAALWSGDSKKAEEIISDMLFNTISYFDYKESFYHAFLVGIFTGSGYGVESNYECGIGRPDIVVKDRRNRRAMVFEVKRARTENEIDGKLQEAKNQIVGERYLEGVEKGFRTRLGYGVVFYDKDCMIDSVR